MAREALRARELAWILVTRNIKAQYRQSLLGYAWIFLPPLLTALVSLLIHYGGLLNTGDTGMPYPVFALTGTLLWQGFADALAGPIRTSQGFIPMLSSARFPREALLLAGLGENLFSTFSRLSILVLVFPLMGQWPPATLPLGLLGVFGLVALGWAVGLVLAPAGALYRDVEMSLGLLCMLWFFITPVIYATPASGLAATLNAVNPVSPLLDVTRRLLITGDAAGWPLFTAVWASSLAGLVLAWALFRRALPHLVKRLQA